MSNFDWVCKEYKLFSTTNIESHVNADKLFVSFLKKVENEGIDINKNFNIKELAELIPKGTANVCNDGTYYYSFMSMLSGQKDRDYYIFDNENLRDEFTTACNNTKRDNRYWQKHCLNECLSINPKYLKR